MAVNPAGQGDRVLSVCFCTGLAHGHAGVDAVGPADDTGDLVVLGCGADLEMAGMIRVNGNNHARTYFQIHRFDVKLLGQVGTVDDLDCIGYDFALFLIRIIGI